MSFPVEVLWINRSNFYLSLDTKVSMISNLNYIHDQYVYFIYNLLLSLSVLLTIIVFTLVLQLRMSLTIKDCMVCIYRCHYLNPCVHKSQLNPSLHKSQNIYLHIGYMKKSNINFNLDAGTITRHSNQYDTTWCWPNEVVKRCGMLSCLCGVCCMTPWAPNEMAEGIQWTV